MVDSSNNSFSKYLLFGGLFFPVGVLSIVTSVISPIYFYEKGIPLEIITLVIGITLIPMIIKFVWGGIADYYIHFGRKRFIMIGGILAGVSLLVLTFADPHVALIPFAFLLFLSWCGMGLLGASADALAIEISQEKERGKLTGSIYAGQNCGMIIAALLLPYIAQHFGYITVFFIAGFMIFVMTFFSLLIKEDKKIVKHEKVSLLLTTEFKKKHTQQLAFFSLLLMMSSGILLFLAPLYMKNYLHLDLTHIGLIGGVFTLTTVAGSLVGGILTDSWGRKTTLSIFIGSSVFFSASLVFTSNWQNFAFIYGMIGFLQGGYTASLFALLMDATNPRIGATQFSIFTGLANLGIILTSTVSGTLLALLDYNRVFLYSACVFGPALLLLYFIQSKKNNTK